MEALNWLLLGGRDDEVLINFDQTLVLKLLDGCPTVLKSSIQVIVVSQLLLCSSYFRQFSLGINLFLSRGFFVSLDLCFGASSLAGLLEEIRTNTLCHY